MYGSQQWYMAIGGHQVGPVAQDEIIAMKAILREAMKAGATGFATSKAATHVDYEGKPVPSRFAAIEEIYALADELGAARRGIFQATIGATFMSKRPVITRTGSRNFLISGLRS